MIGQLLNINQVADLLHTTSRVVYRMVEEGELPQGRLIDGQRRWHFDEIESAVRWTPKMGITSITYETLPQYINIKQLAALFQIHTKTIYKWIKQGHLPPPIKSWGYPRWDKEQVLPFIDERRQKIE